MPEPWKRPRKVETQREYLWCRQRIEKIIAEGIMTLEEIATNPPSDSMKRQARKMWREQYTLDNTRGRFAISYCLGKFEFPGTEEEARKKAEAQALADLIDWKEGRKSFEELFRICGYIRIELLDSKIASRGKISSIAVKR